jgi:uncharacterized membrane protein YgcG
MAERLRSAIESLFNVHDERNDLAPSADERRRRRNEFVEALRSYGVSVLLLLVAAAVIAAAAHFLVWSLVTHIVMPAIHAAIPGLATIHVVLLDQFITYLLYAAIMIALAVAGIRMVLAKPRGYVRERTKSCPACGMTVLEAASKCRYCGTGLPARRPYGPLPSSRAAGPMFSSPRTTMSEGEERAERGGRSEHGDRPPRRGRRGGRRRSGGRRFDSAGGPPSSAPADSGGGSSSSGNH